MKDKKQALSAFKGFTIKVDVRRHEYLMFSGTPRIRKGSYYAMLWPKGCEYINVGDWPTEPTEAQLLQEVRRVLPTVRKIFVNNLNQKSI